MSKRWRRSGGVGVPQGTLTIAQTSPGVSDEITVDWSPLFGVASTTLEVSFDGGAWVTIATGIDDDGNYVTGCGGSDGQTVQCRMFPEFELAPVRYSNIITLSIE